MVTNTKGGGPVSDLYSELQPQLVRILAGNLKAPRWVIDDACQTAWSSLLECRGEFAAGGELGWLSTTATREALRLLRHERAARRQQGGQWTELRRPGAERSADQGPVQPGPERSLELRERLAEIRRLPERQRRVLMLYGFGYEYGEIAAVTGDTRRTVARQLTRARQRLLRLADES